MHSSVDSKTKARHLSENYDSRKKWDFEKYNILAESMCNGACRRAKSNEWERQSQFQSQRVRASERENEGGCSVRKHGTVMSLARLLRYLKRDFRAHFTQAFRWP